MAWKGDLTVWLLDKFFSCPTGDSLATCLGISLVVR